VDYTTKSLQKRDKIGVSFGGFNIEVLKRITKSMDSMDYIIILGLSAKHNLNNHKKKHVFFTACVVARCCQGLENRGTWHLTGSRRKRELWRGFPEAAGGSNMG
jgi:hypothetical protein